MAITLQRMMRQPSSGSCALQIWRTRSSRWVRSLRLLHDLLPSEPRPFSTQLPFLLWRQLEACSVPTSGDNTLLEPHVQAIPSQC